MISSKNPAAAVPTPNIPTHPNHPHPKNHPTTRTMKLPSTIDQRKCSLFPGAIQSLARWAVRSGSGRDGLKSGSDPLHVVAIEEVPPKK